MSNGWNPTRRSILKSGGALAATAFLPLWAQLAVIGVVLGSLAWLWWHPQE